MLIEALDFRLDIYFPKLAISVLEITPSSATSTMAAAACSIPGTRCE